MLNVGIVVKRDIIQINAQNQNKMIHLKQKVQIHQKERRNLIKRRKRIRDMLIGYQHQLVIMDIDQIY